MKSAVEEVRDAAVAEHGAEQNRATAEKVWRRSWWRLNMRLAAVTDRLERRTSLDEAAGVLGVSTSWLSSRRRAAAMLDPRLDEDTVSQLPPRLSIEFARTGRPIDADAVSTLLQAERDEVSVRDFARMLGTQPKSWEREDERASAAAAGPIAPTPQQTKQLATDPAFIREFERARAEQELAHQREMFRRHTGSDSPRPQPQDPVGDQVSDLIRARAEIVRARLALRAAHDALADVVLDDEQRASVDHDAELAEQWVSLLRSRISGSSIDRELADLLSREDS